ncbi:MAG: nucleotidyltransferase domain-containing protein [Candidatus Rokubacteria bacterium]|nr:nucleotidyltransferase domain-containing protein [Candidatus Rokubacteria bacterium]
MNKNHTLTHPDMPDPAVLARIADRLKREYRAERVIVYGSVARGEATIHSDIDLLVVAPSTEKGYQRMATVKAIVRDLSRGLPISPIVLTPEELKQRLADEDPFVQEIVESGVAL